MYSCWRVSLLKDIEKPVQMSFEWTFSNAICHGNDPTRQRCAQQRALAGPRSSLHLEQNIACESTNCGECIKLCERTSDVYYSLKCRKFKREMSSNNQKLSTTQRMIQGQWYYVIAIFFLARAFRSCAGLIFQAP